MNDRRTTICTRPWCELTQHCGVLPYRHHRATVAEFPNDVADVVVLLSEAEPQSQPCVTLDVDHQGAELVTVDLSPGQAGAFAELLTALVPEDVIRFAAALAEGARVLGHTEGESS